MRKPTYNQSMLSDYDLTQEQFNQIFACANRVAPDYIDPFTGECNATLTAEYVAYELQHLEWPYTDSHPLFDICAYVAEQNDET